MKALLFNLKNNLALKQLLTMINVEVVDVDAKDHSKQLGYLLNKDYIEKQNVEDNSFSEEMIILDEFDDQQLDLLLQLLKSNKITIPYKAIVTDTNINWACIEIRNNLIEEYLAFKNKQRCK